MGKAYKVVSSLISQCSFTSVLVAASFNSIQIMSISRASMPFSSFKLDSYSGVYLKLSYAFAILSLYLNVYF